MIVEENALARHRKWRGFGRIVRNRLNGEIDIYWFAPNGRASMRTAYSDDLIPPRKTDVAPPAMEARR